jgi:hypothetical protein
MKNGRYFSMTGQDLNIRLINLFPFPPAARYDMISLPAVLTYRSTNVIAHITSPHYYMIWTELALVRRQTRCLEPSKRMGDVVANWPSRLAGSTQPWRHWLSVKSQDSMAARMEQVRTIQTCGAAGSQSSQELTQYSIPFSPVRGGVQ